MKFSSGTQTFIEYLRSIPYVDNEQYLIKLQSLHRKQRFNTFDELYEGIQILNLKFGDYDWENLDLSLGILISDISNLVNFIEQIKEQLNYVDDDDDDDGNDE